MTGFVQHVEQTLSLRVYTASTHTSTSSFWLPLNHQTTMEEAEDRLSRLCQPDTRFLRTQEHKKATTKPKACETAPRSCLFLVPWHSHYAAVKITIDYITPSECPGYTFSFCSSIQSESCCSKAKNISSTVKRTVERVFQSYLPQVCLKPDQDMSVS
jgi:hypothetical protein